MKTPEEIADDVVEFWNDAEEGYADLAASIAAALTAERARAEKLAAALQNIDAIACNPIVYADGMHALDAIIARARAALAEYDR